MQPSTVHSPWWKAFRPKKAAEFLAALAFLLSPVARYNTPVVLGLDRSRHPKREEQLCHISNLSVRKKLAHLH